MDRFRYSCKKCHIEFLSMEQGKCPSCQSTDHLFTIVMNTKKNVVPPPPVAPVLLLPPKSGPAKVTQQVANSAQTNGAQSFESLVRELVAEREDFEELVRSALESTAQPGELQKLYQVLVKFTKICQDVKEHIGNRMAAGDGSSVSPAASVMAPPAYKLAPQMAQNPQPVASDVQPVVSQTAPSSIPRKVVEEEPETLKLLRMKISDSSALKTVTSKRICLPSLNPVTTEDTVKTTIANLGFEVESVQLFQWADARSRGVAVITMKDAQQAKQLAERNDLIIDEWAVSPRLLLEREVLPDLNPAMSEKLLPAVPESRDSDVLNCDKVETLGAADAVKELPQPAKSKRQLKAEKKKQINAVSAVASEPQAPQKNEKSAPAIAPEVAEKVIEKPSPQPDQSVGHKVESKKNQEAHPPRTLLTPGYIPSIHSNLEVFVRLLEEDKRKGN